MKVKKQYLLLIACLVWTIAGANIVRIGLEAYVKHVTVWNIVLSVVVFVLFQWFVFGKLVKSILHGSSVMKENSGSSSFLI